MPNQPKTQARSIRIPDALWARVQDEREASGQTATEIVVRALNAYYEGR